MSKLETNTIAPSTGTTLTLGENGDTVALGSGVTSKMNHPAFEAFVNTDQTISDTTVTKIQINSETFDTDNCYDPTTNYRFTPTVAGKYFVYASIMSDSSSGQNHNVDLRIYKNGSALFNINYSTQSSSRSFGDFSSGIGKVINMNGSTDYLELYIYIDQAGGTSTVRGDSDASESIFGAYRIGVE